ncbi:MAG: hypothetical protein WDA11_14845 [Thiohalomonadaceae bacterium]
MTAEGAAGTVALSAAPEHGGRAFATGERCHVHVATFARDATRADAGAMARRQR